MITGIDEITRVIREISSGKPTWNQSKNPITVGFSENGYEQSAITRYVSLTCRERTISVNSKRHWISKRKRNFHGAVDGRFVIFYADGVVGLVHDSMRNISMFSRSNDPSELIRYDPSLVHTLLVNIYLKYKNSDASQRRYHELEPMKDLLADARTCSMESNTLIGNVEKVCEGYAYRERSFWS